MPVLEVAQQEDGVKFIYALLTVNPWRACPWGINHEKVIRWL